MIKRLLATALVFFVLPVASAAEFTGYAVLTSDYVWRGVTQSDADPAIQLGGDVFFGSGWFLGAWASTVDIDNGPTRHRDRELNLYAGYAYDVSSLWRVSARVVSYQYPGQTGNVDYDYVEYSLATNYNDRVWLEYSYSPDLYNTKLDSHNVEAYAEWPLKGNWSIGAGAGYYDVSELSGNGYGYWQFGVTGSYQYADIDFRFHNTNRSAAYVSTDERSAQRVAVTVKVSF
jgi:uncharacterized protein (TIGR02001 family)